MAGTTVSHCRVVRRLGQGGMGVVYEAEDLRLGRPVALKFLPEPIASDHDALQRFQAEARAASALNHAHICTIYDADEAGGRPFIAMELLEGEPLRARLVRPLPVPALVCIALQLAEALEAAHAKGIVHRDIKPENAFVTAGGTAKLLDFGIAKLVTEQARAGTTTRLGTGPLAVGTVAYMSPEQARGELLDARTDLFSLGVVLYEMAAGAQPFRGTTTGAVLGEILTKAPVPPVRLNPDLPPELERIVNKLLEKQRELRYQSACDVRVDLERLRQSLAAPPAERHAQAEGASLGDHQNAVRWMTPEVVETCRLDCQYFWLVACAYAMLGDSQAAFDWLENAIEYGFLHPPSRRSIPAWLRCAAIHGSRR